MRPALIAIPPMAQGLLMAIFMGRRRAAASPPLRMLDITTGSGCARAAPLDYLRRAARMLSADTAIRHREMMGPNFCHELVMYGATAHAHKLSRKPSGTNTLARTIISYVAPRGLHFITAPRARKMHTNTVIIRDRLKRMSCRFGQESISKF